MIDSIKNTKWEKFKKFITSDNFGYFMVFYMFVVSTLILINAENEEDYFLGLTDGFLGLILLFMIRLNKKTRQRLQRIINYINIYKDLPPEAIKENQKRLFEIEKKLVMKNYNCLFNRHDVIAYIVTNPGTDLAKYFEAHNETLNICFFKDKFLTITSDGEMYVNQKQFGKNIKI